MKVYWTPSSRLDRNLIYEYIEADSPSSAVAMDILFVEKSRLLADTPFMGRVSAVAGLRELVVHPNYLLIYKVMPDEVWILRVLHAAQKWP